MAQTLAALGLADVNELSAYLDVLMSSHRPRFTYDLFSINDEFLARLPAPEDGMITAGAADEVTRAATATLFDPNHIAKLDTSRASSGIYPLDRILRIQHTVDVPKLGRPVTATPFYGWLTKADRVGDNIVLEGQGLERRALFGQPPMTAPAGTGVVDAIYAFMNQRCGETRFRFPAGHPARLPANVSIGFDDQVAPWPVCLQLAASIGYQLFYSCDGYLTLRPLPTPAAPDISFVWAAAGTGGKSNITSRPTYSTDALGGRNYSQVSSGDAGVLATATAAASHPLSPAALARHGVPMYMPNVLEDSSLISSVDVQVLKAVKAVKKPKKPKHQKGKGRPRDSFISDATRYETVSVQVIDYATAQAVVNANLAAALRQVTDETFDTTPFFHLDVMDFARVTTPEDSHDLQLGGFTLPCTTADMTINDQVYVPAPDVAAIRA